MAILSWLAQEEALSSASLTVRAQTISPNDNGQLLWDAFFPRKPVNSVKLREISTLDYRPVSDRREWNARGRQIVPQIPELRELEMVPVEAFFRVDEREVQHLEERTFGNQDIFRQIVSADIPGRTDMLVASNYRRLEIDALRAWANGTIVAMNPVTGTTVSASYGFDAARYQTAVTAWDDGGVNGYEEFLAWLEDSIDAVGPIVGTAMRLVTFKAIQADAPQGINAVQLTRAQVEDRISQDLGTAFRFYLIENSLDLHADGGSTVVRTKVWPAQKVAVIPAGISVGEMAFAPVARGVDLARANPTAGIDVRGVTVYMEPSNGGRELTVEAQVNAMPIPNEQRLYVIDAGV